MKKHLMLLSLLATALPGALADDSHGDVNKAHKVSICHATHSAKNPYVMITVDRAAEGDHLQHQDHEDVSAGRNLRVKSGPVDDTSMCERIQPQ